MSKHRAGAKRVSRSMATALVLSVTLGYAATAGPELPNPGKAPLSRQQQIQLGFQAASQVYQQMPVLPDNSPETQYIRQLGQKLAATIPQQYSWPFEFHVIPQKEINAFALPGGPMFVNVGTITAAANEAELAGVMSHEMSHVYMQHSAKQAGKTQTAATLAGIAGAILGAASHGVLGQLAQAGINFGAQGIILKYSREDEAQADAVGAIIMYKAGYNPRALADFFQKLAAQGGTGPQFLSDHPNPGNREQAIQQEIANWPPKRYQTSSAAFNAARQHAASVRVYTAEQISQGAKSGQWARLNQQNGAVFKAPAGVAVTAPASAQAGGSTGPVALESVLPGSRLVTTDLGPLKIAHPDNWQVMAPAQKGEDVRIAPQAGVTGNSIGYGVVLNGVRPQNGQALNIDQLTSELVRELESSGGDLKPVGSAQPVTVAGVQGRSVDMQSTSPFPDAKGQPQKERDWLVTLPKTDGSVLYLVFVAPQAEFARFQPTYERMLQSIQLR
ncbi:MAG TPA: M48 family metallopeptidase [Candidatus Binatia bacterium]|nr:M48 family metallopeptidase [Candidatus Binatia bacterium]